MVELDEATRRALLAREGPPASARAEILAGLRTRLDGPDGPDDPDDPGDAGDLGGSEAALVDSVAGAGGQIAWAAKIVGATLGLTGAGLLTIKLAAVALSSTTAEPPRPMPEIAAPETPAVVESDEAMLEPVLPEQPLPEPTQIDAPSPEPVVARATPSKTETESTLAAELALIRAAKQLRDQDPAAALAELELHARRFPTGSLAPERESMRVELLCALGRRDAATQTWARFLEQHGDSPLRARVIASCKKAGTDLRSGGD
jgi:hypothetical protein